MEPMEVNTNVAQWDRWRQVVAACAVLAIVAAFLPWISGFSLQGIRFDAGKITTLCGVAGIGFAVAWHADERGHAIFQLVLGAIVAYEGVSNFSSIAGMGLYLTMIAGVLWFIAGFALVRETEMFS